MKENSRIKNIECETKIIDAIDAIDANTLIDQYILQFLKWK